MPSLHNQLLFQKPSRSATATNTSDVESSIPFPSGLKSKEKKGHWRRKECCNKCACESSSKLNSLIAPLEIIPGLLLCHHSAMQTFLLLRRSHQLDLITFSERSFVSKLAQPEMLSICKAKAIACQERNRKNPVERKHSPGPALCRSVQNAEGRRHTKVVNAQSSGSRPVGTKRCTLNTWKLSIRL